MCGRFTLTVDPDVVQQAFDLSGIETAPATRSRYNIAPTQAVLATVNDGQRRGEYLHWGLVPSWAKDPKIGSRMINARSETLAEKRSFRTPYKKRRCVIYADGFYEWQPQGDHKQPLYIRLHEGAPFAMAGLWEVWQPPDADDWLRSCTIITTAPNAFMKPIHNRMPVILGREAVDRWLSPDELPPDILDPLLKPYADVAAFSAYPVSKLVNNPRNDVPAAIERMPEAGRLL